MALYLKYRPLDFSSLVGQEFIKSTLKAAVAQDKTVGAYIFTWPRGTGKTSTARIFAKAINCESPIDWDPDLKCSVCQSFADENLIDIIEIDAASHTGVDNIREIIEKAQFRPTQSKYKIYIVDEVHMLSKWAFNALLKILEEPPKHVKFILATTEIHKVPDTILSRCQRYDFKNFSSDEISNRLRYIADQEGVTVDEESYNYIVKSSEGGMRNAVSLFEQLIQYNTISYQQIIQSLGIMSEDEKKSFIQKLYSRDISLIEDFSSIANSGKNLKIFFKDILSSIQSETIKLLQAWEDISVNIFLMDTLSEMLMKSKNSFDEVLTYRIGLLKLVSSYIPPTWIVAWNTSHLQAHATTTSQTSKNISNNNQGQDDLVASVEDIFAIETPVEITDSINVMSSKEANVTSDIDVNKLTQVTKENGWKAALSMTLKWSIYSLDWDVLNIRTKTSIAKNTLNKSENRDILFVALEKMGITVSDIQVS